jgi:hypothetical protein
MSMRSVHNSLGDGELRDDSLRPWSPAEPLPIWVPQPPVYEDGSLVWRPNECGLLLVRLQSPVRELLPQFLSLERARDEDILSFAARWGPLDPALCRVWDFYLRPGGVGPDGWLTICGTVERPLQEWREKCDEWRAFSGRLGALLRISARLREGKSGAVKDWVRVYPGFAADAPVWQRIPEEEQIPQWKEEYASLDWCRVRDAVNRLLISADVRPSLRITDLRTRTVALGGHGLLGALSVQLLYQVCQTHGMETCSYCGGFYRPRRAPRAGENHYCEDCTQKGIPARLATRALAARKQEAWRLSLQGQLPAEIARALGTSPRTVRCWVDVASRAAARRRGPRGSNGRQSATPPRPTRPVRLRKRSSAHEPRKT